MSGLPGWGSESLHMLFVMVVFIGEPRSTSEASMGPAGLRSQILCVF